LIPDEKAWIARAGDLIVALNEHASECLDERHYATAIAEWNKAIAEEGDASESHDAYLDVLSPRIGIGLAYERSGKWREAREAWLAAFAFHGKLRYKGWYLYVDPETPDKANALFESGKYSEGLAGYDYNYNTGVFDD
jgi:tetratricopeptide (TPR) repeat protein